MDCPLVFDLATRLQILDRAESLYGPDLILWATYFFSKSPGAKEIPWHQDLNYWPLEPVINLSAWIAIDHCSIENACVQLIPGSHKRTIPHIPADDHKEFGEMADPTYFDASQAIPMELMPGEFFLFNEKVLHYSPPNNSQRRRRGMTARFTIPLVRIEHEGPPLHAGHKAIVVRGEDRMGFKQLGVPPAENLVCGGTNGCLLP
jgi:ectoine hydroxylase-related dioxygenase (phytanoyl-CoA dioxygenase family)